MGDIATKLNVSTMPVREALRTLEAQGMITFSSQKKITVTQLSAEDLEEHLISGLLVRASLKSTWGDVGDKSKC